MGEEGRKRRLRGGDGEAVGEGRVGAGGLRRKG